MMSLKKAWDDLSLSLSLNVYSTVLYQFLLQILIYYLSKV